MGKGVFVGVVGDVVVGVLQGEVVGDDEEVFFHRSWTLSMGCCRSC